MNLNTSSLQKIISAIVMIAIFYSVSAVEPALFSKKSQLKDTLNNRKIQVSFVPFFGTNGNPNDSIATDISVNILAGYVYSVNVAEFGGMVNIVRQNAGKFQIAGIGNVVGNSFTGVQFGGVFNTVKNLSGIQVAGNINYARHASGIQISGLLNHIDTGNCLQIAGLLNNSGDKAVLQVSGLINNASEVEKFQISGLVNHAKKTNNFQIAGLVNHANQVKDFQIAGLVNNTPDKTKLQIAGLVNNASKITSSQIAGLFNNSENIAGAQISGLINYTRYFKGVQIGVVNIADSCDGIAIGVINFIKNGYHKLEFSSDEMFLTNLAFRSGLKKFHTILTAGLRPNELNYPLWTYGVGIGTAFGITKKSDMDLNFYFQNIIKGSLVDNNFMYKFYIGIDRHLSPKASIFFGLTYNFLVVDKWQKGYAEHYEDLAPYSLSKYDANHFILNSWLGFKAGVRLF